MTIKDSANADVFIDGKPTKSLEQRAAALSHYEGTAIKADNLLSMSKDKGREFVKPHRVIYIYHDQIDAVGDKAVSESNTFDAARKAINELYALVSFIINSLNGTRVIITADHGFIYQEKAPSPIDKSKIDKNKLESNHKEPVKTHKRFLMGKNLGTSDQAFSGKTSVTAHTETECAYGNRDGLFNAERNQSVEFCGRRQVFSWRCYAAGDCAAGCHGY